MKERCGSSDHMMRGQRAHMMRAQRSSHDDMPLNRWTAPIGVLALPHVASASERTVLHRRRGGAA